MPPSVNSCQYIQFIACKLADIYLVYLQVNCEFHWVIILLLLFPGLFLGGGDLGLNDSIRSVQPVT